MAMKKAGEGASLTITQLLTGKMELCLLGVSRFVFNAMSEKAKHELLLPKGRKTAADKAANLKHNPYEEFRGSVYAHREDDRPTRLFFPGSAFRKAMQTAALDLPGVKKAQVGRLVWVDGYDVDIYGVPKLYMAVVRSADINKTPDIRTRAALVEWGCRITVSFVRPLIKERDIGNLLAAAGLIVGVGDGRQEKGAFSFGQFEIVSPDDPRFMAVVETGGRGAQDAALAKPEPLDLETEKLLSWFDAEVVKLGDAKTAKAVREAA